MPFFEKGPRIRWGNDQVGVLGLTLSVSSVDIWLFVSWTPPPLEQEGNTSIPLQQLLPCNSVSKAPVRWYFAHPSFCNRWVIIEVPPWSWRGIPLLLSGTCCHAALSRDPPLEQEGNTFIPLGCLLPCSSVPKVLVR